jgi:hypothetical protein
MAKAVKNPAAQIVTGNRLRDGVVIFLTSAGDWSTNVDAAEVVRDVEGAARLTATATAAEKARIVVAPYLIEVKAEQGRVQPTQYRERIRAFGPSIAPDAPARLAS